MVGNDKKKDRKGAIRTEKMSRGLAEEDSHEGAFLSTSLQSSRHFSFAVLLLHDFLLSESLE